MDEEEDIILLAVGIVGLLFGILIGLICVWKFCAKPYKIQQTDILQNDSLEQISTISN